MEGREGRAYKRKSGKFREGGEEGVIEDKTENAGKEFAVHFEEDQLYLADSVESGITAGKELRFLNTNSAASRLYVVYL